MAILAAGCGGEANFSAGRTFDAADVESKLTSDLASKVGIAPKSVDCPESPPADEGDTFECTGTAPAGDQFTIEITAGDAEGDFDYVVPEEQFKK